MGKSDTCEGIAMDKEAIIERYRKLGKIGNSDILKLVPEKERRYKCHSCHLIVDRDPCPNCGGKDLEIMCPLDHCGCGHEISSGIKYCPLCGRPICVEDGCYCHDVIQISRVTGYLSTVENWNLAKQAELKDRHRYMI
jgi:anaerobic ribonucleoside-triphosphate reductase